MPRQYTQRAFIGGNLANAEDWNSELSTAASELNGQLDQNNMPLAAVDDPKMADPVTVVDVDNTTVARFFIAHSYMPTQSYHISECSDADPTDLTFFTTTFNPDDWRRAWHRLAEKRTTAVFGTNRYAGSELQFQAQEGMIVGEILFDASWRISYWSWSATDTETDQSFTGATSRNDAFIEVGVFVNDVCCARTDFQWHGGRFTYHLPFSTPIGTTPVLIDIRFRLRFDNVKEPASSPATSYSIKENWINPFQVRDSQIWARNVYR
jgi:hypothetical protein